MPGRDITFTDRVKGAMTKKAGDMKDLVIVRSNGTPVFHLANVVDDIHMGVTHVIRGDDHVENTFRHVPLFEALGAPVPEYAHLPMIVNAHGKPYSKRDGDAYVGDYRDHGYLPEALFNYLALLGWSPGHDREQSCRARRWSPLFDFKRACSPPPRSSTRASWNGSTSSTSCASPPTTTAPRPSPACAKPASIPTPIRPATPPP
jgi:glutamyl/glutaminyl-tRNA synthetase